MIAIGSDHAGFPLKEELRQFLAQKGIACQDFGTYSTDSCDYPDMVVPVCEAVLSKECQLGILVCGTGIGVSIAANKHHGIRAALCGDCFSAKYTRLHNDANILCLGARVIGAGLAAEIVTQFLENQFEGGKHGVRLQKISVLEQNQK